MKKVEDILRNRNASGVYVLAADIHHGKIAKVCEELGHAYFLVRGEAVSTKANLLEAISRTLQFPSYFGANWDALEDCLTDMSWVKADSYVIVCDSVGFFAGRHPHEFETILSIFKDTAEFWKSRGVGFYVLLAGGGVEMSGLSVLEW